MKFKKVFSLLFPEKQVEAVVLDRFFLRQVTTFVDLLKMNTMSWLSGRDRPNCMHQDLDDLSL